MGNMFKMGAESELQKIVFYNINDAIVIYSLLEVVVSVFQKRAIFEGKPKNFYSRIIQDKVSKFFGNGPSNDK